MEELRQMMIAAFRLYANTAPGKRDAYWDEYVSLRESYLRERDGRDYRPLRSEKETLN